MTRQEMLAAVLAEHILGFRDSKHPFYCTGEACQWHATVVADGRDGDGVTVEDQHRAHVAAALDAALAAQEGEPEPHYIIERAADGSLSTRPGTSAQEGDQGEAQGEAVRGALAEVERRLCDEWPDVLPMLRETVRAAVREVRDRRTQPEEQPS